MSLNRFQVSRRNAPFQVSGFQVTGFRNPFKSFKSLIGYAELKVHFPPFRNLMERVRPPSVQETM